MALYLLRVFCDERTDLGDEHGGRTLSKDSGIWAPETVDALFENVSIDGLVGALKRGFELQDLWRALFTFEES